MDLSKEGLDDAPATRPGSGSAIVVADAGALLLLIALILGGIGVYRLRTGGGTRPAEGELVISVLLLAAYVVADLGDGREAGLAAHPHADESAAITASGSSTETISSCNRTRKPSTRARAGGASSRATSGPRAPLTSQ